MPPASPCGRIVTADKPASGQPDFSNAATNIPSVPWRCGQRRCRIAGAEPSGPGVSIGTRSGRWRMIASTRRRSPPGGTCTPSRRADRPGRSRSAHATAISTWSRASRESSSRRARQSSSGRRRAEPIPEHGASTSTRSKGPRTAGTGRVLGEDERRGARAARVRSGSRPCGPDGDRRRRPGRPHRPGRR